MAQNGPGAVAVNTRTRNRAPAEGEDEWAFLRNQPDFDEDEMSSVRRTAAEVVVDPEAKTSSRGGRRSRDREAPARALTLEMEISGRKSTRVFESGALIGRRDHEEGIYPDIDLTHDVSVSRRHARIALRDGWFVLRDMGSLNGTVYNGRRLAPDTEVLLKPGDRIEIGSTAVLDVVDPDMESPLTSDEHSFLSGMLQEVLGRSARETQVLSAELVAAAGGTAAVDLLDLALKRGSAAGLMDREDDGVGQVDTPESSTADLVSGGRTERSGPLEPIIREITAPASGRDVVRSQTARHRSTPRPQNKRTNSKKDGHTR